MSSNRVIQIEAVIWELEQAASTASTASTAPAAIPTKMSFAVIYVKRRKFTWNLKHLHQIFRIWKIGKSAQNWRMVYVSLLVYADVMYWKIYYNKEWILCHCKLVAWRNDAQTNKNHKNRTPPTIELTSNDFWWAKNWTNYSIDGFESFVLLLSQ